jgi:hypothetical protein
LVAEVLYMLGSMSTALDYPPAYLSAVWGVPLQLLVLGGLVGLHARQVGNPGYGRLGTAGFLLAFVGSLLAVALGPLVYSGFSGGVSPSFVGMIVTGAVAVAVELGLLLLGVATLRTAVLPLPWRALPLVIFLFHGLFNFLGGFLVALFPEETVVSILLYAQPLLLGLGWALLGYALWSGIGEGAWRRPSEMSEL